MTASTLLALLVPAYMPCNVIAVIADRADRRNRSACTCASFTAASIEQKA